MPGLLLAAAVLLAGAALGGAAATPEWWIPASLALAAAAVAAVIVLYPRAGLVLGAFLVLAAITKFRVREGTALLEGEIDGQVVFELAAYAAILAIVVLNVLASARRGERREAWSGARAGLGAYVLLALVSTLWSADRGVTAVRVVQLAALYALSGAMIRSLGPEGALATLTAAVVAYVFVGAGLALAFPWAHYTYVSGLFSWFSLHPGVAGTCAAIAGLLLLAGALCGAERRSVRVLRWAAILALAGIVVATHQRTPVLACFAAGLTLVAWKALRPGPAILVLGVVFAVVVAGLRAVGVSNEDIAPSDQANPVVAYLLRGQTGEQFLSLTGRTDLWGYIATLVGERPLIGYGYVASRSILLERFPWAGSAHSALLEVLLNLGLIGAALLFGVAVRTLGSAYLRRRGAPGRAKWAEAAVLAVLVYLAVDAVAGESFAGAPGCEVFAFFVAAMAYEQLAPRGR
jgi:O-antigen ligase